MLTLHLLILTLTLTLALILTLTLSECNAFLWRPVNYNLADFAKTGRVDPKFQVEEVAPTNHFSSH